MAKNTVRSCGSVCKMQPDGRYHLVVWHRLEQGRIHEEEVVDLSWSELCDCLLTMIDGTRPGWEVGDGWRQPDLATELDLFRDL